MKKRKYNCPTISICQVEAQSIMALSKMEGSANPEYDVLINQNEFTDIWGNNWQVGLSS